MAKVDFVHIEIYVGGHGSNPKKWWHLWQICDFFPTQVRSLLPCLVSQSVTSSRKLSLLMLNWIVGFVKVIYAFLALWQTKSSWNLTKNWIMLKWIVRFLSKLLHWFVKVVTCISRPLTNKPRWNLTKNGILLKWIVQFVEVVTSFSRLLPNKTKLKFDKDFEVKRHNALGPLCLWQYSNTGS